MTIRSYTAGHNISQTGGKATYIGSNSAELVATEEQVSDGAKTSVDLSDKLTVSDLDSTPNLEVGFREHLTGVFLSVTNRSGEFDTQTSIPVNLKASEVGAGSNLGQNLEVARVTVENRDGVGTFVTLTDTSGVLERPFLVTPDGKLQSFLQEGF